MNSTNIVNEIIFDEFIIPYRKIKRSKRIANTKHKNAKLYNDIKSLLWYKPSIYIKNHRVGGHYKWVANSYISYGKHSNAQKWMKKYSNKVFRKLKERELKTNGKIYRRYFDYWWTWL